MESSKKNFFRGSGASNILLLDVLWLGSMRIVMGKMSSQDDHFTEWRANEQWRE